MSRPHLSDLGIALSLLSRVPVPIDHDAAAQHAARAAWAFPVVGAGLGLFCGGVGWGLASVGLPAEAVAACVLAVLIFVTGALHEDGLADSADGLFGGWTREKRLEIMRDSRIGAYGVLAIGLSLLLRWSCLTALLEALGPTGLLIGIPVSAALSRAAMVPVMTRLPHAREDGLARHVGQAPAWAAALASVLALALALMIAGGLAGATSALAAALAAFLVARTALSRIGGQTGDILGAAQQCAEIAVLLMLAAIL